ncbi:Ribulose-phosphate 3 epimerase family protein [uncultured archaeon]|nr:Ribulose-phosphate 3 epimerase family protein [uncultured archaeon]
MRVDEEKQAYVMLDIAPAILVYTPEELAARVRSVPSAKTLHIDIMDGKFVNNTTIGTAELQNLPADRQVEYHLMVSDPVGFIQALPGGKNRIFEVQLESVMEGDEGRIKKMVEAKGSKLAWVLNPPTPLSRLLPHLEGVHHVLLMTVNPGWAGQAYMGEVEEKMRQLRQLHPKLVIEIDGGVGPKTILHALKAGANRFAAASAVFGHKEPDKALKELERLQKD